MQTVPKNRQSAWRTIGTEISGLSYGDALEEAGIAYEVNNIPLNVRIPVGSGPMGDSLTVGVEGKRLNYRTDSLDPLGIVGDRYQVTQMRELGTIVESLVGEGVGTPLGWFASGWRSGVGRGPASL